MGIQEDIDNYMSIQGNDIGKSIINRLILQNKKLNLEGAKKRFKNRNFLEENNMENFNNNSGMGTNAIPFNTFDNGIGQVMGTGQVPQVPGQVPQVPGQPVVPGQVVQGQFPGQPIPKTTEQLMREGAVPQVPQIPGQVPQVPGQVVQGQVPQVPGQPVVTPEQTALLENIIKQMTGGQVQGQVPQVPGQVVPQGTPTNTPMNNPKGAYNKAQIEGMLQENENLKKKAQMYDATEKIEQDKFSKSFYTLTPVNQKLVADYGSSFLEKNTMIEELKKEQNPEKQVQGATPGGVNPNKAHENTATLVQQYNATNNIGERNKMIQWAIQYKRKDFLREVGVIKEPSPVGEVLGEKNF